MYRKLYVDGCVDIVCNAVKVQSPLTLEQLCQIIQENLPGSCVPRDNLKEDARLVILDDSSFTIEYPFLLQLLQKKQRSGWITNPMDCMSPVKEIPAVCRIISDSLQTNLQKHSGS